MKKKNGFINRMKNSYAKNTKTYLYTLFVLSLTCLFMNTIETVEDLILYHVKQPGDYFFSILFILFFGLQAYLIGSGIYIKLSNEDIRKDDWKDWWL